MKGKCLNFNSIRAKLIVSLIGMCIIPLIIFGFTSYIQSKTILNNKLTLTSAQTISEIDSGLNNYFRGFIDIVSMASNNFHIVNVDEWNNFNYVPDLVKEIKECDVDILNVYFGTESGKISMYPDSKLSDGYDARQKDWYKIALKNKGKVIITPPYQDLATGNMVVGIVKTVEKNGEIVGVIGLDCSLKTLTEKLSVKKVGATGSVFLTDSTGTILAHPNSDEINKNLSSDSPELWNKMIDNRGFITYQNDGISRFGAYQTNLLTGWKVAASINESELTNDTKSIIFSAFLAILIMALISIVISFILSKGFSQNINKLKKSFIKASDGDLTTYIGVKSKDEFKDLSLSFNLMIANVVNLMKDVSKSSSTILETSTSLTSMSQEITASTSEVAKSIEEVSSGAAEQVQNAQTGVKQMDELSIKLDQISTNSIEMNKISNETKELSSKGLSILEVLIEKSDKTRNSTIEVNNIVRDMNKSTNQINSISETIASITEQTSLLSLNASIESARAGEAGRGFAIVAEEIRKLAEQSKVSTGEIKVIIANIQQKSDVAVKAISSTENIVNEQNLAVNETKNIFNEILKAIEIMISKVDDFRVSIDDMNNKRQSAVSKIETISFISEQTASSAEKVTASAEEISTAMEELTKYSTDLNLLAGQLETQISKFKIN